MANSESRNILKSRIDYLIEVMKRAEKHENNFRMSSWYFSIAKDRTKYLGDVQVGDDLPECGTAACFAGWCAVDPVVNPSEHFLYDFPVNTVRNYLLKNNDGRYINGLNGIEIDSISHEIGRISLYDYFTRDYLKAEQVYYMHVSDIKPKHVIKKLQDLQGFIDSWADE